MPGKLAIKRLTASDLTIFKHQYSHEPAGKQKAINLNKAVLETLFFPAIGRVIQQRFQVDTYIYGPGFGGEYNVQRKILKQEKNWRLNGELIDNPLEEPHRFNGLKAGDIALFDFSVGEYPSTVIIDFISNSLPEDHILHAELDTILGGSSMLEISLLKLQEAITASSPDKAHPVYRVVTDEELEDVALGSGQAVERILSRPNRQKVSPHKLALLKESAARIGLMGEQLIYDHLTNLKVKGVVKEFEWVSFTDAISPYDFWVQFDEGSRVLIDVKATEQGFECTIHVSYSELKKMASGPERYDIYRVFKIAGSTAQLRIAKDVEPFAKSVLGVLNQLPGNVVADAVSVLPKELDFGPSEEIQATNDENE